jgi:predicted AAA+ superfamily ATPase
MPNSRFALIRDLVETRRIPENLPGVARQAKIDVLPGKATVLMGVRRCGKSTLMAQWMAGLRSRGVPRGDILHLDFFDERLAGFGREEFQSIVEAFLADRGPGAGSGKVHAFFDEIQETTGWEGFVHRAQQSLGWQVYLTGSSSRMLSKEIATQMRGRSLSHELFPFSFREYLRASGLPEAPIDEESRAAIAKTCDRYLAEGGFPESVGLDEPTRVRLHQEYFSAILQRDLILRNDASHPVAVRDLALKLLRENACLQSNNRLTASLQASGHAASKTFVAECLDWMHDAYLVFPVPIHARSATKRQANPRKWYCVDTGLARSVASRFTQDDGRTLEAAVFLALRRRGLEVAYHRSKSGKEADFVFKGEDGRLRVIQACWDMGRPDTRARELSALEETMAELKPYEASIVTHRSEERLTMGGKTVPIIPAWRFLLEA